MSAPKSVQLRSKEAVIETYENWGYTCFSITAGNQFFFKFEGDDPAHGVQLLAQMLTHFESSAGIYTLNVFEEKPAKGIKINTPSDGSINFQLQAKPAGYLPPEIHAATGGNAYQMYQELGELRAKQTQHLAEIETLKKELEEAEADIDQLEKELESLDRQKPKGIMGAIEPMMPMILGRLCKALGVDEGMTAQALAGIQEPSAAGDQENRVNQSLNILFQKDAQFDIALEKMALLATKHPDTFDLYMQQLKAMVL